jgi:hypothetical protein
MIPSPTTDSLSAPGPSAQTEGSAAPQPPRVKVARVLEEEEGEFSLEYDDTRGEKNTMRLDALSYDRALREARSFLGIQADDRDEDGARWTVE